MEGGDAERGRLIFQNRVALSCVRCHSIDGKGKASGPDLSQVTEDNSREYLLESIVAPNAKITKGFATVVLTMDDGRTVSGIVKHEDEQHIQLTNPDGKLITLKSDDVTDRVPGKSAMPEDLVHHLNLFELRDLIEYLYRLKAG